MVLAASAPLLQVGGCALDSAFQTWQPTPSIVPAAAVACHAGRCQSWKGEELASTSENYKKERKTARQNKNKPTTTIPRIVGDPDRARARLATQQLATTAASGAPHARATWLQPTELRLAAHWGPRSQHRKLNRKRLAKRDETKERRSGGLQPRKEGNEKNKKRVGVEGRRGRNTVVHPAPDPASLPAPSWESVAVAVCLAAGVPHQAGTHPGTQTPASRRVLHPFPANRAGIIHNKIEIWTREKQTQQDCNLDARKAD
jgi:hypothetical protein